MGDPAALVEAINAAQAELEADEVEQARQPETKTINRAEVYMMIDYLGDVGAALKREHSARRNQGMVGVLVRCAVVVKPARRRVRLTSYPWLPGFGMLVLRSRATRLAAGESPGRNPTQSARAGETRTGQPGGVPAIRSSSPARWSAARQVAQTARCRRRAGCDREGRHELGPR